MGVHSRTYRNTSLEPVGDAVLDLPRGVRNGTWNDRYEAIARPRDFLAGTDANETQVLGLQCPVILV